MLATRDTTSDFPAPGIKDTLSVLASTAFHPLRSWRWLQFIKTNPLLCDAAGSPLSHLARIHRPYLARKLGSRDRMALIASHYEHAAASGFGPMIRQAMRTPLQLCTFKGRSGKLYELQLSALELQRQDGELVLRLLSHADCIYSAAFLLTVDGEHCWLTLGALDGMLAVDRNFGIKQVTRDLYGVRPKDLMVTVLQDIAGCLGCEGLVLVGNRNKLPERRRHFCKKSADYDRSWRELRAAARADGNFELPPRHPLPAASGQNAAYTGYPQAPMNRGTQLLDSIRCAVHAQLGSRRTSGRYNFAAAPASAPARTEDAERPASHSEEFAAMRRSHP